MFHAIALEGPEIVAIPELHEQVLQDSPITLAGGEAKGTLKMILQVLLNLIVIEQRIIRVDEDDDWMRLFHARTRSVMQRFWRAYGVSDPVETNSERFPLVPRTARDAPATIFLGTSGPGAFQ